MSYTQWNIFVDKYKYKCIYKRTGFYKVDLKFQFSVTLTQVKQ